MNTLVHKVSKVACVFLFITLYAPLFAQDARGKGLCDILTQVLKKNNTLISLSNHGAFITQEPIHLQPLISSATNDFPFNITVDIPQFTALTYERPSDIPTNSSATTFIIVFSIEEVVDLLQNTEGMDFLSLLLERLATTDKNCNVQLLFAYGDNSTLLSPNNITGERTFLDSLVDRDDKVILRVALLKGVHNAIAFDGAPSYLTHLATDAFFSIGRNYDLSESYSTRIFPTNTVLNIFSEASIPTCSVTIDQMSLSASDIARLIAYIIINYGHSHENRALAFKVGVKTFWISEGATTIAFLFLTFFAIFSVIQYTVLHASIIERTRHDIVRLLYILPMTIFLVTSAFTLGQKVTVSNNLLTLAVKVFFAFCFVSALFLIIIKVQGTLLTAAYSYFITITGVINIFLFSSLDISLFWLFCAQYFIVFLSRYVQHTLSICIFFLLLGVPFAPYLSRIIQNPLALSILATGRVQDNILCAFVFVPFALVWLRILVRLNYKWSKRKVLYIIRDNFFVFLASLIIVFSLLFFIIRMYKNKVQSIPNITYITNITDTITAKTFDNTYFGETSRTLKIHTTNNAERVIVAIRGNIATGVLYSEHPYITNAKLKTTYFLLPAYPGKDITISYIANNITPSTITISATYPAASANEYTMDIIKI